MGDFLHDDIVCNILARLPAKSLLRFRCVSKHWNRMLRDPSFMKLRSRKTIFLPLDKTLHLIDDNNANSVVTRPIPTQYRRGIHRPRVIGTFNGIVLLITLYDIILYNPFTRVSKELPRTTVNPIPNLNCLFGFGYAHGDEHDLKVVRI
ncbi:putative F-box domain-containing protein [Helianthus annuus]|nr:putative F-box domain-containing protein [Helianthus annuus]KAJ0732490.1 putative F-box domain-containing protein [Helianthus annuus]